ncbi:MAG: hypothetical protein ACJAWI_002301, partial [Marinomonas primoryensis]
MKNALITATCLTTLSFAMPSYADFDKVR